MTIREMNLIQTSFIKREYVLYSKGSGRLCCHVDAVHAAPPGADLYTGEIVTLLMSHTGCAGIIGTVSRFTADLNRGPDGENDKAVQDYRDAIWDILNSLGMIGTGGARLTTPYLHLAVHGMRDMNHGPFSIEIGTRYGHSCSAEMKTWFASVLIARGCEMIPELQVVVDKKFVGDSSIVCHRSGDGKIYRGYGPNFNTLQIEISRTLREHYLPQIVQLLSLVIFNFQSVFVGPHIPFHTKK